jgi:hypothetical protein
LDSQPHPAYVWATVRRRASNDPQRPDFDTLRVSAWSQTRGRYENIYVERGIAGFYPLQTRPSDGVQGFTMVSRENSLDAGMGKLFTRKYRYQPGLRSRSVRMAGEELLEQRERSDDDYRYDATAVVERPQVTAAPKPKSWQERLRFW